MEEKKAPLGDKVEQLFSFFKKKVSHFTSQHFSFRMYDCKQCGMPCEIVTISKLHAKKEPLEYFAVFFANIEMHEYEYYIWQRFKKGGRGPFQ